MTIDDDGPDDDVLAALRDDPARIEVLYRRYAHAVALYLVRRVGVKDADDLLSEVFAAALSARKRVVPHASGSALPWLYGIAGNVVRSHLRRASPHPARFVREASLDWDAVDARVDAQADRDRLHRVLDALSPGERDVLLLVAWEGLAPAEAARALGISAGAARFRLHQARRRAQRILDSDAAGDAVGTAIRPLDTLLMTEGL